MLETDHFEAFRFFGAFQLRPKSLTRFSDFGRRKKTPFTKGKLKMIAQFAASVIVVVVGFMLYFAFFVMMMKMIPGNQ